MIRRLAIAPLLFVAACTGAKDSDPGALNCGAPGADPAACYAVHAGVFTTGGGNNRLVVSGTNGYVVASLDNKVERVRLSGCAEAAGSCPKTGEIVLPPGASPYDAIVSGGSLWIANLGNDTVTQASLPGLAVVTTLDSTGSLKMSTPQSFGYAQSKLFVSNGNGFGFGPGFVAVVTGTSITASITTTQLFPVGITPLPNGQLAIVNGGLYDFPTEAIVQPGGIDLVDPATETIVRNIPLGLTLPGPNAEVSADGSALWVPATDGTLFRVGLGAADVPEAIELTAEPTFLSWVTREGDRVYVASFSEDRIYVLHESGDVEGFIEVGPGGATPKGPVHIAVYGGRLYVALTLANEIAAIDLP